MNKQQNTQQPVARISLHRVDGVPRATLLQTLGGAAVLPIGEIDVYAAPVVAANEQQNTQQPVAYRWRFGSESLDTRWHYSDVPLVPYSDRTVESLYTAPPVPRDVLMAAMRDAVADLKAGAFLADCGTDIAFRAVDYSAIADRYASQVQPERNTVTLEEMVAKLKASENGDAISEAMTQATADMALGRSIREGRANQPEPVNQQLLAALKLALDSHGNWLMTKPPQDAWQHNRVEEIGRAAIAAAEAARPATDPWQPSGADYDRSVHHCPDAKDWADLFVQTYPGLASKHDLMLVWFANAMMAMHDHMKEKHPASAQPVAVPDGWQAAMAFASAALAEAIQIAPLDRLPTMAGAAMQQIDAMLSAAQKPEGWE